MRPVTSSYHHALHPRAHRYAKRAVADHADMGLVALGHAVDLLLHRAGIGVDEDGDGIGHGPLA
ncbi:hypothetical protein KUV82_13435 [Qipengyuania flava]|nr:hypothetical protein KUV82_13435 [Qipengyuania flava]